MASLYEIDAAILDCIDLETGEIIDEARLTALQMERDRKIESVACWVKNLEADAAAYKAEAEAFSARRSAAERKAESLKKWLIEATGGMKMALPKASISFRSSERVEITDDQTVPKAYLAKTVILKPDKAKIKEALKNGKKVKGCTLLACKNILIK